MLRFPFLILLVATAAVADGLVPAADIEAAVARAWSSTPGNAGTVEVLVAPRLPWRGPGAPDLEVVLPEAPLPAGTRAVPVSCREGGRVVARGLVTIAVRREAKVWIATRPIAARAALTPDDVRRETRVLEREPGRSLGDELAAGVWVARRALEPGAVLRATDVSRRPDVAVGAGVLLVSRAGDASVAVSAIARRSGDIGDRILVHNPVTGEIVEALLVEAGVAELVRPARRPVPSPGDAP